MTKTFYKDPNAVLDYIFDYASLTNGTGDSDWLQGGDALATGTVTADAGLTVNSSGIITSNTQVRAWLSGGAAGNWYRVHCRITTTAGRTDDRTINVKVTDL